MTDRAEAERFLGTWLMDGHPDLNEREVVILLIAYGQVQRQAGRDEAVQRSELRRQQWIEVYEAAGFDNAEHNVDADHETLVETIRILRAPQHKNGGES